MRIAFIIGKADNNDTINIDNIVITPIIDGGDERVGITVTIDSGADNNAIIVIDKSVFIVGIFIMASTKLLPLAIIALLSPLLIMVVKRWH